MSYVSTKKLTLIAKKYCFVIPIENKCHRSLVVENNLVTIFLENKTARGKVYFTTEGLEKFTGKSDNALKQVLIRLRKKNGIATPISGFHLIIPPKYKKLKCLPADEFIDHLMSYLGEPYYVGLLSAAMFHGAAHQAPQKFFVMVGNKRKNIVCGSVHIVFLQTKNVEDRAFVEKKSLPSGFMNLSSVELTALDLVRHMKPSGGISHVATIIQELSDSIEGEKFGNLGKFNSSIRSLQRLGFLVEFLGYKKESQVLYEHIKKDIYRFVGLVPSQPLVGVRNEKWKIIVNQEIEADL